MFYIVRLSGIKEVEKHYVFPINWMKDSNKQLEKFIRMRLNANQTHIFFWSNEKKTNGQPNDVVEPNFNLVPSNTFPPATNACYFGQPVYFYCDYEEAMRKVNELRSVEPAVYNSRRLLEKPVPDVTAQQSSDDDIDDNLQGSAHTAVNDNNPNVLASNNSQTIRSDPGLLNDGKHTEVNVNINKCTSPNDAANQKDTVPSSSSASHSDEPQNLIAAKIEPTMFSLNRRDSLGMESVFKSAKISSDVDSEESSDEIEFHSVEKCFPFPMKVDELVKQENDAISGNLAFQDKVTAEIHCICSSFIIIFHSDLCLEEWQPHLSGRKYIY